MMAEIILLVAFAGITLTALRYFVPYCFRLTSLYWAHAIRDQIYKVGEKNHELRDTLLYRDAEFVACLVIYALRNRDPHMIASLANSKGTEATDEAGKSWRIRRWEYEMNTLYPSLGLTKDAMGLMNRVCELEGPILLVKNKFWCALNAYLSKDS